MLFNYCTSVLNQYSIFPVILHIHEESYIQTAYVLKCCMSGFYFTDIYTIAARMVNSGHNDGIKEIEEKPVAQT